MIASCQSVTDGFGWDLGLRCCRLNRMQINWIGILDWGLDSGHAEGRVQFNFPMVL